MSKQYSIEFTERAQSAYDRLPDAVKSRVEQILERIQQSGLRRPYVTRISGQGRIYLSRVTDRIRLVVQVQDDVITVLDIVSHDQLQRLSRYWS